MRLVVASAPALTIGFVSRPAFSSMAITELNGSPVLFTPSFAQASSGPIVCAISANTNGLATLMMVKGYSVSPAA